MITASKLKNLEANDVLNLLGLETKRGTGDVLLPALSFFGVGLLVGAGIGLLFAPKTGSELRQDLRSRLSPDALSDGLQQIGQQVNHQVDRIASTATTGSPASRNTTSNI